jgi:hypothetical protein
MMDFASFIFGMCLGSAIAILALLVGNKLNK